MKQTLIAFILFFSMKTDAQTDQSKSWATGINKVIESYPGNFTALKGQQTPGREYWSSSLSLEGAGKTYIMNFEGVTRFHADFATGVPYEQAGEKFKELVKKMESVKPRCCVFSKTQNADELIWQIQDAKSGFEHLYLSIKLRRNLFSGGGTSSYDVQLSVFNKRKYDNISGL